MANYNYYPYTPYTQPYQATSQPQQPIQPQQIHNGGYVSVRSEDEARMHPVAPGNSVTFINELAPFIYKKTMGFSQFDRPIFEIFRLVPEKPPTSENADKPIKDVTYAEKSEIEALQATIEALKGNIDTLNGKISGLEPKKPKTKKEGEE